MTRQRPMTGWSTSTNTPRRRGAHRRPVVRSSTTAPPVRRAPAGRGTRRRRNVCRSNPRSRNRSGPHPSCDRRRCGSGHATRRGRAARTVRPIRRRSSLPARSIGRRRPTDTRREARSAGDGCRSGAASRRRARARATHRAHWPRRSRAYARSTYWPMPVRSRYSSAATIAKASAFAPVVGGFTDLRRWAVGISGLFADAAGRGEDTGQPGARGIRPGGAVGRRRRDHQPGVFAATGCPHRARTGP